MPERVFARERTPKSELEALRPPPRRVHTVAWPQSLLSSDTRSMSVAFAVPPPSQIARRPYLPRRRSSSCTSVVINLQPVPPRGCPSAMAPPFTLTLSKLPPVKFFAHASGTGAKASFTSTTSSCSGRTPALRKASAVAGTGPSSMTTGSSPTTAMATTLAFARKPNFCKPRSLQMSTADAPSQTCEDDAGVTTPFWNIGFSLAMDS
mmetsp:Transcript_103308/g.289463  ORF Transcript_103308/g.289463 Transcript_103308/m.289463 type:complete len:207 (-) Transcript_103308:599-1219(-)